MCCFCCSAVPGDADVQREAAHDSRSEHLRLAPAQSQQPQSAHAQPPRLRLQRQPRSIHQKRLPQLQWRLKHASCVEWLRLRLTPIDEHLQRLLTHRCVSTVTTVYISCFRYSLVLPVYVYLATYSLACPEIAVVLNVFAVYLHFTDCTTNIIIFCILFLFVC